MKPLLILFAAVAYIFALLCLAVIVFLPSGFGIWGNHQQFGYAFDFPLSIKAICLILLVSLLIGGLYFLWQNIFRTAA
jgi:hypothetical protein